VNLKRNHLLKVSLRKNHLLKVNLKKRLNLRLNRLLVNLPKLNRLKRLDLNNKTTKDNKANNNKDLENNSMRYSLDN
jgi:hypothetical protein